jgi:hypothetical protein
LLFIQNEFTPSNMATNLTDEKIYKSWHLKLSTSIQ